MQEMTRAFNDEKSAKVSMDLWGRIDLIVAKKVMSAKRK